MLFKKKNLKGYPHSLCLETWRLPVLPPNCDRF